MVSARWGQPVAMRLQELPTYGGVGELFSGKQRWWMRMLFKGVCVVVLDSGAAYVSKSLDATQKCVLGVRAVKGSDFVWHSFTF